MMEDEVNDTETRESQEVMDTFDNESSSSEPKNENGLVDDSTNDNPESDEIVIEEASSDTNGLAGEESCDSVVIKEVDRSPEEIIGDVSSPMQDNVINEVMEDSEVADDSMSKDGMLNHGGMGINEDSTSMDVTEITELDGFHRHDSDSNGIVLETVQEVVSNESSINHEDANTIGNVDSITIEDITEVSNDNDKATNVVKQVSVEPDNTLVDTSVEVVLTHKPEAQDKKPETIEMSENKEVVDSTQTESKDKKQDISRGDAEETEVVSEDELPQVEKPKIKDAENVSDDELPGPKPAELPADTEVVSEDELPAVKKDSASESRKRKKAETEDTTTESYSKKQALSKNGESKSASSKGAAEEKHATKALPELEKYWKVVIDDPTDFTGWTYLLQYVDQENDVEAARKAYDAFLSHYPYCYGYWRKYSDYEKRKGSKKKCNEVLERGLKAIPLSVDLWIHYLNHIKTTRAEDPTFIRSQYERGIETCGLEFRSDRLWESYIKWEAESGTLLNVTNIYDRLLATPTMTYTTHFDNFQEHIMSADSVANVIPREDIVKLRAEVRDGSKPPQLDLPPGEDEPDDHIASEEEGQAIKERFIAIRKKVHKATADEVAARWTFEEGIKRPYFHVKPLERCQLKNWKAYLEWEKQNGSFKRAYILHERCLIACALYDEFWLKLVRLLEERAQRDPSVVSLQRAVLERACTVHHTRRPALHLTWATFEETQGDHDKAAQILLNIDEACPDVLEVQCRRINLERRRGALDACAALYRLYIGAAKTKPIAAALAVKYARFLRHVRGDARAARDALDAALLANPLDPRLHLQRLDLALHTPDTPYSELDELVRSYEQQPGADPEVCVMFAWRRRELAEELGDLPALTAALRADTSRRHRHCKSEDSSKKKESSSTSSTPAPSTAPPYYPGTGGPTGTPTNYEAGYAHTYPNNWGYSQQAPGPYQHAWQQYPANYY